MLVGEGPISAEMQKRVSEMIKTFLERARTKLETTEPLAVASGTPDQEPALDPAL